MLVSAAVLDKYLSCRTEMDAIFNDILMPRIQEVCLVLHRFKPEKAYIYKTNVAVQGRYDSDFGYTIPIELLWDMNWESWIEAYHEKQRVKYEREHARLEEQSKKATEEKELAELARLLAKYPQAAQKPNRVPE